MIYRDELAAAEQQGRKAYEEMESWVSAPIDTPPVEGAVLERHARELRQSRERMRALLAEHGERDDIMHALAKNEEHHRALGLSIRDKPELEPEEEA